MNTNAVAPAPTRSRWPLCAALFLALTCLAAAPPRLLADGILIPERPEAPNFAVKYHRVEVSIEGQVATTRIDQVFVNQTDREQEAVYVFPLPHGAVVRHFVLYDEGRKLTAELLDRDKATEIYESIVRKRRDPALLEYIGRDTYRVRVFPMAPKGTKRVQLEYAEALNYDSGVITYNYPLSTEKFSAAPIEEVTVAVRIESQPPIKNVYSPTHEMDIKRPDDHTAFASLEEHNTKPDVDLTVHYTISEQDLGTALLAYKEPGQDGFFLLLAAPSVQPDDRAPQPKDVVFVLDKSGSMSGEKIEQAKQALLFCLNQLNDNDRFRLVTFSSTVEVHADSDGFLSASRDNLKPARQFVEGLTADGGTDIHSALQTALDDADFEPTRPTYLIFLTDGLPTVGETNIDTIAEDVARWNAAPAPRLARLFVFGVGYDVNTQFLEQLAQGNGGVTEYVRPEEDIEVKVSRFFAKVGRPVLTAVALDIDGVDAYDLFPREMPDIFAGSQVLVFGRYRTDRLATAQVRLSGFASPDRKEFVVSAQFPTSAEQYPYIAPLWASRKIGWLLDEIMLHGESKELVDEIVALSTRYGILTEYTAFLAEEGARLTAAAAAEAAGTNVRAAYGATAGSWATSQRQNAQVLRGQSNLSAQNVQYDALGSLVRYQQVQTRNNQAFFNRAGNWQDARYREGVQNLVQVKAFSDAYFQLTRRAPALNQYFALGDQVLVVVNGQAIQIADDGRESFTEAELDALLGPAPSA